MSTGIQWTDETWNPVVGCDRVSPGCARCYAKTLHDMRHKASLAGKNVAPQYAKPFETVQLMWERMMAPLSWRKPRRVFVNSVSDLFHDDVPDEFIDRVFSIMTLADWHTFQILTKRPARMLAYMTERWQPTVEPPQTKGDDRQARVHRSVEELVYGLGSGQRFGGARWWTSDGKLRATYQAWPLSNVWLGVSVENQRFADERIPLLMETPAAVRFLSCEPLLGHLELDFDDIAWRDGEGRYLDWVIVGGESGKDARVCDLDDVTDVVAQCDLAGVACFVKQLGAHPVIANDSGADLWPGGSIPFAESYEPHHQGELGPLKLRDSHGGDMAEWPEELRVREFPASGVRA